MTRNSLLMLATILTSVTTATVTAGLVLAGVDGPQPQTRAIEAEAEVRSLARYTDGMVGKDRHLALSERLSFEPADPGLGPLERVALDIELHVEQGFSGTIGDAGPLEEAPEPVSIEAGLNTRLEIVGPDGSHLLSTMIPTAEARCAARGSCTFAHHERRPVTMRFEPPVRAFQGDAPVSVIVRATTTGGVLAQLCGDSETWGRCQVHQARIGVTVPPDGIKLSYIHEGAMAPVAAESESGTLPVGLIAAIASAVGVAAVAGIAILRRTAQRSAAA